MIGKHFWELFPEARVAFENYYDPLPDGRLANYYQDISARKQIEEKLRRSEALLAKCRR